MPTEICHYRLSLRGKPVGSQSLSTRIQGRVAQLESKLTLQGSLGNSTVVQRSRVHQQWFYSYAYSEETQEKGSKRNFQVSFDPEDGLVKAQKGSKDKASIPRILPYVDPLGLLHRLRFQQQAGGRIPMLGKTVVIEQLADSELDTSLGKRLARVYQLRPGGSLVYVDSEAPHAILLMNQRLDGQVLDAILTRIDTEEDKVLATPSRKRNSRKRRVRRRKTPNQLP